MTRHPRMGAAQQPAVAVRKLVESKAIRETSLCASLLLVNRRFTGVNLLIPLAHHRGDWFWEENGVRGKVIVQQLREAVARNSFSVAADLGLAI
jgi:hypothetical protein